MTKVKIYKNTIKSFSRFKINTMFHNKGKNVRVISKVVIYFNGNEIFHLIKFY